MLITTNIRVQCRPTYSPNDSPKSAPTSAHSLRSYAAHSEMLSMTSKLVPMTMVTERHLWVAVALVCEPGGSDSLLRRRFECGPRYRLNCNQSIGRHGFDHIQSAQTIRECLLNSAKDIPRNCSPSRKPFCLRRIWISGRWACHGRFFTVSWRAWARPRHLGCIFT